jgi:hypothetical protein
MLVPLMLEQSILPHVDPAAAWNLAKVSPLLPNAALSGPMFETQVSMKGPAPVLSPKFMATTLMFAMQGPRDF